METKDLMIGDLVRKLERGGHSIPVKIIAIYENNANYETEDGHTGCMSIHGYEPIPLTAKILDKNGFEEDDYYLQYRFYLDNKRLKARCIAITPQDEDWEEIELDIMNHIAHIQISLNFVHELQHALRLCGIEKEIVL